MDPYLVLGVPRNCTRQQVRKTFRARVQREHPDRGGEEQKFILICTAYKQVLADLDRAADSAASERASDQDLVDLLQRISARSVAEKNWSRPAQSAGFRRSVRGDSGAEVAGVIALTIFIAEVLVSVLVSVMNVGEPPPVPAAPIQVEDVFRPPMDRAENEGMESQQKPARTTAQPRPGWPSQPPQSEAGSLITVPPYGADLNLTPGGLSSHRDY